MSDIEVTGIERTLERIESRLTGPTRAYVTRRAQAVPAQPGQGAPAVQPTDEEVLTNLRARLEIAQAARTEARNDLPLSAADPGGDAALLLDFTRRVADALRGADAPGFAVGELRRTLAAWSKGEGAPAHALVDSVVNGLVRRTRERTLAAARAAQEASQPRVRPVRTNEEVLHDVITRKRGEAGPSYDPEYRNATQPGDVKSVLVVAGVDHHGANGRGDRLATITVDLIERLTDRQEKWTVTGCAEVAALNRYLLAAAYPDADAALRAFTGGTVTGAVISTLSLYGRTADKPGSWDVRQPCHQCQQWLKALRITVHAKGARS
ncbi:hypothetical protein [Kitasatospora camelliae]|uniref:Uncharacterized protein n=1 Tax=Kitasatospora camelliae TaxID=3156397 RepID=A0AAU8K5S0_9ACTN